MAQKTLTWEQFDALKKLLDAIESARTCNVVSGELAVDGFSATWNNTQVIIAL
jgi:urocanate hydratase